MPQQIGIVLIAILNEHGAEGKAKHGTDWVGKRTNGCGNCALLVAEPYQGHLTDAIHKERLRHSDKCLRNQYRPKLVGYEGYKVATPT